MRYRVPVVRGGRRPPGGGGDDGTPAAYAAHGGRRRGVRGSRRRQSGLLGERAAIALDDAAQLAGGLFASVCCGLSARRTRGVRRNWRRLMAIGMLGWSIGQL